MDDAFLICFWLGVLFLVLVLFSLPPKYTDQKILGGLTLAIVVTVILSPFGVKSTWDKYHAFDAGKIPEITDTRSVIASYQDYGPKAPAIFTALLFLFAIVFLGCCWWAQFMKLRQKKLGRLPPEAER